LREVDGVAALGLNHRGARLFGHLHAGRPVGPSCPR
jgi:hypothetical protein